MRSLPGLPSKVAAWMLHSKHRLRLPEMFHCVAPVQLIQLGEHQKLCLLKKQHGAYCWVVTKPLVAIYKLRIPPACFLGLLASLVQHPAPIPTHSFRKYTACAKTWRRKRLAPRAAGRQSDKTVAATIAVSNYSTVSVFEVHGPWAHDTFSKTVARNLPISIHRTFLLSEPPPRSPCPPSWPTGQNRTVRR